MRNFFKKFEVKNFRSFGPKQELIFGVPNEQTGSGLTILVGPNNAGKTTLVEALLKNEQTNGQNTVYEEDKTKGEPCFIFTKTDKTKTTITTVKKGSAQLKGKNIIFQIVPSRRSWSNRANSQSSQEETASANHEVRSGSSINVANKLAWLETQEEKSNEYNSLLKKIFDNFSDWTISESRNIGKYISYTTNKGKKHAFDIMGDGVSSVFRILLHITTDQVNQPLIIDEPELSLQPEAQRKLLSVIGDSSKKRQIIIATHSPYFIDLNHFENGARIARINKPNDDKSIINNLQEYSKYRKLLRGDNWQQPFLMDEVAKDVFFNDNILFVEGHEDKGLIKKYYKEVLKKQPTFNVFGYGVRGMNNFKIACKFAQDLGLQKVVVLIDGGKNAKSIYEELIKEYQDKKLNYKILQHKHPDIRVKLCNCCQESDCKNSNKEGYFDTKGKINKDKKDDFNLIVQEIEGYFTNLE